MNPAISILVVLVVALIASVVGGALSGLYIGAKALGKELALTTGGFFGPLAGFTGVALGLVLSLLLF